MRGSRNPRFVPNSLILSLIFLVAPLSIAAFQPAEDFLLACGAATGTVVPDGRLFVPDYPSSATLSGCSSTALSSSAPPPLYRTARAFPCPSSYLFPLAAARAGLLLRLHFHPFPSPSPSLNLSAALFNVSASGVPLLSVFSPAAAAAAAASPPRPLVREFYLKPNSSSLRLTFSPTSPSTVAFINAIELFSAPDRLFSDAFTPIPSLFSFSDAPLSNHLLETVFRINVGGSLVTPDNDTLWRTWEPDDKYLQRPSRAQSVTFGGHIHHTDGGATPETAPDFVYGTARAMNKDFVLLHRSSTGGINISIGPSEHSLTWKINALLNGVEILKINGVVSSPNENSRISRHFGVIVASVLGCLILACAFMVLVAIMARRKSRKDQMPQSQDADTWSPLPVFPGNSYLRLTELTTPNLQLRVNLAEWAMHWQKKRLLERIIDPSLKAKTNRKSLKKFGETVEKCLAQYGIDRPTMGDVLWNLEYALQLHERAVHQEPGGDSTYGPSDESSSSVLQVSTSAVTAMRDDSTAERHGKSSTDTAGHV
ncbi:hypothetical protein OPV22_009570 [Ensete ventricosum]|uniref:Malectin-like domain-containing protein n=1 Tax=Ensete ventricosum TaxID=4639 RepID=A0AAV8RJ76_ENSVE|nr:hypothetical protein OPV22_009570 [Ensete ventricosum]